jgi:hypothetical protein
MKTFTCGILILAVLTLAASAVFADGQSETYVIDYKGGSIRLSG